MTPEQKYMLKVLVISLFVLFVLYVFGFILSLLGTASKEEESNWLIENETNDTVYIEIKYYNATEWTYQKIVSMNNKYFLTILPHANQLLENDDTPLSFEFYKNLSPMTDTLLLVHKTDTLNFIYGKEGKYRVEQTEHGFDCYRTIDYFTLKGLEK